MSVHLGNAKQELPGDECKSLTLHLDFQLVHQRETTMELQRQLLDDYDYQKERRRRRRRVNRKKFDVNRMQLSQSSSERGGDLIDWTCAYMHAEDSHARRRGCIAKANLEGLAFPFWENMFTTSGTVPALQRSNTQMQ